MVQWSTQFDKLTETSDVRYPLRGPCDQTNIAAKSKITRTIIKIVMHHPDLVSVGESICQYNDSVEE